MPLPTLTPSDFSGFLAIATDRFTEVQLQSYIDEYLPIYLRRLVGSDIANEIATTDPLPQKYADLLDGVTWEDDRYFEPYTRDNTGITRILKFAIYYEFVRRQTHANAVVGTVTNRNENSEALSSGKAGIQAWQRLAEGYNEFNDNVVPFLQYYKRRSEVVTASTETSPNVYQLTIANTTYIEVGDFVEVQGVAYAVTAVSAFDVTFNSGETGQDFTGANVVWKPFDKARFKHQFANLF